MKPNFVAAFCIALMLNCISSYAWGPEGHDIIASIAERHLTRKTRKELDRLLEGKSIIYYASWMDNLRNAPDWKNGRDSTKTWHYANVDEGYTYQAMPKNPAGDVVTSLNKLTATLASDRGQLPDSTKADYVKMIVHMVGDMHCPMHAGRLSDRGGNSVKVKWFGKATDLHSVWDSHLVGSSREWSFSEWTDQLDRTDREFKKNAVSGSYEDWFDTTVGYAAQTYDYIDRKGTNLSYQFIYDFSPVLEEQLLLAGYRLAHVLNSIFK